MNKPLSLITRRTPQTPPRSGWFPLLVFGWLCLWSGSCVLIWNRILVLQFGFGEIVGFFGLPLSFLLIVILLVFFVRIGIRLTQQELDDEYLSLASTIKPNHFALVKNLVSQTRYRLLWIVGGIPLYLWFICESYMRATSGAEDLEYCSKSLLGNTYCHWDGPSDQARILEIIWLMCITVSLLMIGVLATTWTVGFTLKYKNTKRSTLSILMFILPLVLLIVFVLTPEVFLQIDAAYTNITLSALQVRVLWAGIAIAGTPIIIGLVVVHIVFRRK